jgi:hypothetical protein
MIAVQQPHLRCTTSPQFMELHGYTTRSSASGAWCTTLLSASSAPGITWRSIDRTNVHLLRKLVDRNAGREEPLVARPETMLARSGPMANFRARARLPTLRTDQKCDEWCV